MNMTQASTALFEALWYSQLPCYDTRVTQSDKTGDEVNTETSNSLLKKCLWKGRAIPCAAIFK